jgi:hypothetical protein
MAMKMQPQKQGLDADSDNRAKTSMVQKTPDGTGPDYTGSDFERHLDKVASKLELLKKGFQHDMEESGNLLKNLVDNAYFAEGEQPEDLAKFLQDNPKLDTFLKGLDIKNLRDIDDAVNKAYEMGLDLKTLAKQLNDIANKPAPSSHEPEPEPEAAQSSFKQFTQSKSSGGSKASGPTKIVNDRIHGGTAEVPKKGLIGSIGQKLFGPKDVNTGEKANRGILGAFNPKNWKRGR